MARGRIGVRDGARVSDRYRCRVRHSTFGILHRCVDEIAFQSDARRYRLLSDASENLPPDEGMCNDSAASNILKEYEPSVPAWVVLGGKGEGREGDHHARAVVSLQVRCFIDYGFHTPWLSHPTLPWSTLILPNVSCPIPTLPTQPDLTRPDPTRTRIGRLTVCWLLPGG